MCNSSVVARQQQKYTTINRCTYRSHGRVNSRGCWGYGGTDAAAELVVQGQSEESAWAVEKYHCLSDGKWLWCFGSRCVTPKNNWIQSDFDHGHLYEELVLCKNTSYNMNWKFRVDTNTAVILGCSITGTYWINALHNFNLRNLIFDWIQFVTCDTFSY